MAATKTKKTVKRRRAPAPKPAKKAARRKGVKRGAAKAPDKPTAPEEMIERAERETSLYLGRRKTRRLVKPFKGIRTATVVSAIYAEYGIATQVARALGVALYTVHHWKKTFEWIRDAFDEARDAMLDIAESSLLSAARKEEGWATCFMLKCRGKERGYVEKLVLGGSLDSTINVNLGTTDGEDSDPLDGVN